MADYQLQSSRFHKEATFSSGGFVAPSSGHALYGEQTLRITVENVLDENSIEIQCKLRGAKAWNSVAIIKGNTYSHAIDIANYDLIRFKSLSYNPAHGSTPKVIATGFFNKEGGNKDMLAKLDDTNRLLMGILCEVEKIHRKQEIFKMHIESITDEEINGDL